jgi:cytoskeletal protein CcmA (bactofilin family)
MGKSTVSGGIFEKVKIDGVLSVDGDLICDTMELNGVCDLKGNVSVRGKADMDGVCKISGDLDADGICMDGQLSVSGNATAENAKIDAAFNVDGTFNVGSLDLKFHYKSVIKEVVGGKMRIYRGIGTATFRAELIEGDEVDIENSDVKVIRGDNVTIGKGCTVDKVEYSDVLNVHPKAKVKEKIKLN